MAVERIRLLTILGPYESLDRVIRVCAQSGCFQPENASGFIGDSEGYSYLSEENPYSFSLMKIRLSLRQDPEIHKGLRLRRPRRGEQKNRRAL